jgi:signal transduction histidine kinase
MAIARTVIEQHGGRMDIQSQVGRGTQVRVALPVVAP